MNVHNMLESALGKLFQSTIMFVAISLHKSGPLERCSNLVGSSRARKHQAVLDRLANDEHCSLLRTFVNYARKIFMTLSPDSLVFCCCSSAIQNVHIFLMLNGWHINSYFNRHLSFLLFSSLLFHKSFLFSLFPSLYLCLSLTSLLHWFSFKFLFCVFIISLCLPSLICHVLFSLRLLFFSLFLL